MAAMSSSPLLDKVLPILLTSELLRFYDFHVLPQVCRSFKSIVGDPSKKLSNGYDHDYQLVLDFIGTSQNVLHQCPGCNDRLFESRESGKEASLKCKCDRDHNETIQALRTAFEVEDPRWKKSNFKDVSLREQARQVLKYQRDIVSYQTTIHNSDNGASKYLSENWDALIESADDQNGGIGISKVFEQFLEANEEVGDFIKDVIQERVLHKILSANPSVAMDDQDCGVINWLGDEAWTLLSGCLACLYAGCGLERALLEDWSEARDVLGSEHAAWIDYLSCERKQVDCLTKEHFPLKPFGRKRIGTTVTCPHQKIAELPCCDSDEEEESQDEEDGKSGDHNLVEDELDSTDHSSVKKPRLQA